MQPAANKQSRGTVTEFFQADSRHDYVKVASTGTPAVGFAVVPLSPAQKPLLDVDNHAGDIVFRAAVESRLDHRFSTLLRVVISCQNSLNNLVADAVRDTV